MSEFPTPRVVVSRCLGFEKCRYDGSVISDPTVPMLKPHVEFITPCPGWGTQRVKPEGEARHYCPNENGCPPQIKGKIEHFVSRRAMDIEAAEATIDALYQKNLVRDVGDLYSLTKEQLLQLDRFADKSAQNLTDSIEASKEVPFPRVLYALGIRFVGETVARKLATHFRSIDELAGAGYDQLIAIHEIGDRIARSITRFFSQEKNTEIIEKLRKAGVRLETEKTEEKHNHTLQGATIVISGTFENHSRKELQDMIAQHGGKNTSSVSSNTDYLLAGDNAGTTKMEQARRHNIPVISEDDFLKMIGGENL